MATNRHDTLDPALLRPGRLDRKIEFPMPDRRQKRLIFSTITAKMNLSEEVDLEDCIFFKSCHIFANSFCKDNETFLYEQLFCAVTMTCFNTLMLYCYSNTVSMGKVFSYT